MDTPGTADTALVFILLVVFRLVPSISRLLLPLLISAVVSIIGACILPWALPTWLLHSSPLEIIRGSRPRQQHSGHRKGLLILSSNLASRSCRGQTRKGASIITDSFSNSILRFLTISIGICPGGYSLAALLYLFRPSQRKVGEAGLTSPKQHQSSDTQQGMTPTLRRE
ncbi:hypothetical protein F5Y10DRAFT_3059 [Nemania abortiva]|nr:hypothetical protein F5Y10DRAFT_3059 [Nemania abortiva]